MKNFQIRVSVDEGVSCKCVQMDWGWREREMQSCCYSGPPHLVIQRGSASVWFIKLLLRLQFKIWFPLLKSFLLDEEIFFKCGTAMAVPSLGLHSDPLQTFSVLEPE